MTGAEDKVVLTIRSWTYIAKMMNAETSNNLYFGIIIDVKIIRNLS